MSKFTGLLRCRFLGLGPLTVFRGAPGICILTNTPEDSYTLPSLDPWSASSSPALLRHHSNIWLQFGCSLVRWSGLSIAHEHSLNQPGWPPHSFHLLCRPQPCMKRLPPLRSWLLVQRLVIFLGYDDSCICAMLFNSHFVHWLLLTFEPCFAF